MGLNPNQTATALLAPAAQQSAAELWHNLVTPVMPALAGPYTTGLVGVCAAVIICHLVRLPTSA